MVDPSIPAIHINQPKEEIGRYIETLTIEAIPVLDGTQFKGILDVAALHDAKQEEFQLKRCLHTQCKVVRKGTRLESIPIIEDPILPVIEENGTYVGAIPSKRILQMLQQELRQWIALFENTYDGLLVADEDGKILRVNKALERLSNVTRDEYVHKTMNEIIEKGIFQRDSVTMKALVEKKSVTGLQEYSTGVKVLVTSIPIVDECTGRFRVLSNVHDVTELIHLQDQLEKTKKLTSRYHSELIDLRLKQMKEQDLIAESKQMLDLVDLAARVAQTDSTILLMGESGVGKEVLARIIHQASKRNETGPYIRINCGAIPRELLESELFGYESGAFTGAKKQGKPGIFELANEGTLLLDEVGELPLDLQVKLLRVLQEQEFTRIGGTNLVKVDVRIVAATNRDLVAMVREGKFRQDLYYRLHVIPIEIPPLRERVDDIIPLLIHFLQMYNRKYGLNKSFSKQSIDLLLKYSWPGNIRELANVVERTVLMTIDDEIRPEHLPTQLIALQEVASDQRKQILPETWLGQTIKNAGQKKTNDNLFKVMEREMIIRAVHEAGSIRKAASILGVSHTTLLKKIKQHQVDLRHQGTRGET